MPIKGAAQGLGGQAGALGSWSRRLAEGLGHTEGHGTWDARTASGLGEFDGIGSWRTRLIALLEDGVGPTPGFEFQGGDQDVSDVLSLAQAMAEGGVAVPPDTTAGSVLELAQTLRAQM